MGTVLKRNLSARWQPLSTQAGGTFLQGGHLGVFWVIFSPFSFGMVAISQPDQGRQGSKLPGLGLVGLTSRTSQFCFRLNFAQRVARWLGYCYWGRATVHTPPHTGLMEALGWGLCANHTLWGAINARAVRAHVVHMRVGRRSWLGIYIPLVRIPITFPMIFVLLKVDLPSEWICFRKLPMKLVSGLLAAVLQF